MTCVPKLTEGNTKLGKLYNWSIPANPEICIAATKSCSAACYAKKHFYKLEVTQKVHKNNYISSLSDSFSIQMISIIQNIKPKVLRIHTSGDFYSDKYVKKWIDIICACPNTKFFTYTRVWEKEYLLSYLKVLNSLSNMILWCSIDIDNYKKWNNNLAATFSNVAVMLNDLGESFICSEVNATVAFLVKKNRIKKINSAIVCPKENGINKNMTCHKCKICWNKDVLQKVKTKLCSTPSESILTPNS